MPRRQAVPTVAVPSPTVAVPTVAVPSPTVAVATVAAPGNARLVSRGPVSRTAATVAPTAAPGMAPTAAPGNARPVSRGPVSRGPVSRTAATVATPAVRAYELRTPSGHTITRSLSSLTTEFDAVSYRRDGLAVSVVPVVLAPGRGWIAEPAPFVSAQW